MDEPIDNPTVNHGLDHGSCKCHGICIPRHTPWTHGVYHGQLHVARYFHGMHRGTYHDQQWLDPLMWPMVCLTNVEHIFETQEIHILFPNPLLYIFPYISTSTYYTFIEFHSCQILSPSIGTNILDEVTQNP